MIVPFGHVLLVAGILFALGVFCAVVRRNLIMIVLGIEIMLNAVSIVFVGAALRWNDLDGQTFVLFILAVAATEVSVGLAIIVYAFRRTGSFDPSNFNLLR
ncbi:MAG TPA: NADH-quinone oxidoreductase subunit NuoK [Deltaproteobacteria bacterium]|jgi:NADH-quinone oxidoreductase subunit K|nr:NADH-quinone oxidoreductase subunit NuoK [Deltaproteobacteria bacterium]